MARKFALVLRVEEFELSVSALKGRLMGGPPDGTSPRVIGFRRRFVAYQLMKLWCGLISSSSVQNRVLASCFTESAFALWKLAQIEWFRYKRRAGLAD